MKNESNKVVFPQLAQWVLDHSKKSNNPFVHDSSRLIKDGLSLLEKLPEDYRWLYSSLDAHKNKIDDLKLSVKQTPIDCNRVHWNDYARNWEAYAIMSYWRGVELIIPAIRGLNLHEMLAPAVLSRSLLELSATFLQNANIFQKYVEGLPDMHSNLVVSSKLEILTNKAIWGNRMVGKDDPLMAKNVLSTLQSISKVPNASDLYSIYEYLCEVAHPNAMGNARFWSHVESVDKYGYEKRVISRFANTNHVEEMLDNTLWSLGWGSSVIHAAFMINSAALRTLIDKLK